MTDIGRRHSHRGFTLVEIMISIAVLSMISLAMVTAMRTLANTQESLTRTTDRVDEMRQVSQFLRQSLQRAQGGGAAGGQAGQSTWQTPIGGDQAGLIRSEVDEIVWSAPLDSIQGMSGITYIRLYRDDDQLKLQFLPSHMAPPDMTTYVWEETGDGYLLVTDVSEFSIAYRPFLEGPWVERMAPEAGATLPQSIGLTIRAHERYWPQIVVSPFGASY